MSKIRVRSRDQLAHQALRDLLPSELHERYSEADLNSVITIYEPGAEDSLQMFEVVYGPDEVVDLHSHDEDELIYVVEGNLKVGNRVLEAGASIFVAGDTLYGFTSGPEGVRFVNFRPRADLTFRTAEEFMQRRRDRASTARMEAAVPGPG